MVMPLQAETELEGTQMPILKATELKGQSLAWVKMAVECLKLAQDLFLLVIETLSELLVI